MKLYSKEISIPTQEERKFFYGWKVLLPVVIGVSVVILMFWHEARDINLNDLWSRLQFNLRTCIFLFLGLVFLWGRVFGLSWRFRTLTDRQLSWKQAYKVDLLCEFTSCVTPSVVGGSSVGMIFMNSQGIEIGRATTLMIITLFLDELFFVISCPLVVLLTPAKYIFASDSSAITEGIKLTFWIVYGCIALWTLILFTGIIWKPSWIRWLFTKLSCWHILYKWSEKIRNLGENMVITSLEIKKKRFKFWMEAFAATALSWVSRYLVVNALFLAFLPSDDNWQWVILARQFVIWVLLLASPTPGASGISEWVFSNYYGDLVPGMGMALLMAIIWRIYSYYIFLGIGSAILPSWMKESYNRIRGRKQLNSI